MNGSFRKRALQAAVSLALLGGIGAAHAAVNVQCPGDTDGDAIPESVVPGPNGGTVKCMHLTAGDGFSEMSDGHPMYTFGFADKTGVLPQDVIAEGILEMLADDLPDVRRRAAVATGQLCGPDAADRLADLLFDRNHGVRFAAAGQLEKMGRPACTAVLERLKRA